MYLAFQKVNLLHFKVFLLTFSLCPFGIEKSIYDLFILSTNICLVLMAYLALDLSGAGGVAGRETDMAPALVECALITLSKKQSKIADMTGAIR